MNDSKNKVSQAMDARTNPLHGSNGGEMLATAIRQIPLENIRPDPDQPRRRVATDGPEWEGLLASVREHGVLQPILLRKHPDQAGSYVIICGERRWRAACEVGASHITARIVNAPAMLAKRAHYQLMENALRQELSPLDEMEACVHLAQAECLTQLEIGKLLGVGRSVVADIFKLDRIAAPIREQIRQHGTRFSRRQLLRIAAHEAIEDQQRALDHLLGADGYASDEQAAPARPASATDEPCADASPYHPATTESLQRFRGLNYGCLFKFERPTATGALPRAQDVLVLVTAISSMDFRTLAGILRRVANHLEFDAQIQGVLEPHRQSTGGIEIDGDWFEDDAIRHAG